MRAVKLTFPLAIALTLMRLVPIYYHTSEFHRFVGQQIQQSPAKGQLKRSILTKAEDYQLPIREENINITSTGSVYRVDLDYRVPVDFFLFQRELAFHSVAAGLSQER